MYIVLGGIALLLIILLIGGVAMARRRKPAVISSGYGIPPVAGNMPGAPGAMYGNSMPQQQPGQSYGNSFVQPPTTVSTPSQVLPQRPAGYGVPQQPGASLPNAGYRPPGHPAVAANASLTDSWWDVRLRRATCAEYACPETMAQPITPLSERSQLRRFHNGGRGHVDIRTARTRVSAVSVVRRPRVHL